MAVIKIKKVKSAIKKPGDQKKTLLALGLKKIGQVVEHQDTPSIIAVSYTHLTLPTNREV